MTQQDQHPAGQALPPRQVLDAIRRPRRVQLHDPTVKTLLVKWKKRGRPIQYLDLRQVADLIGVKNPKARTRRKIVEAVEAAGIEIHNFDEFREGLAETGRTVGSRSARWWLLVIEERRWRWPEKADRDDRRKRATCFRVRRGRLEYILNRKRLQRGDEILPWPDCEERWS